MPPGMTYFPLATTTFAPLGACSGKNTLNNMLVTGLLPLGITAANYNKYLEARRNCFNLAIFDQDIRLLLQIGINDCTTLQNRIEVGFAGR